jgi:hypothetical protein
LSFYDDYFNYDPSIYEDIKDLAWEGEITLINEDTWSTNGRVMAFRTYLKDKQGDDKYGLQEDGTYNLYMLTNSTYNKDIVRVSSNNALSQFVFEKGPDGETYGNALYKGNEYRSVIFDLSHYRPFRFAAQVEVYDKDDKSDKVTVPLEGELLRNEDHGDLEENKDNVLFSYKPGQKVDILMDITSFKGSDNRSVHPFGELFGEEFEVYIDAPMLEIDQSRVPENWKAANNNTLKADKLRPDPSVPGRFIYTVSKTREQERKFGFDKAHHVDEATARYDDFGGVVPYVTTIDQSGERKRLPFKKTSITSKGDINITANKDKVVFWDKTFEVKTEHMKGILKYKDANGIYPVPDDAFIAFVRLRTNARIGVVTLNPSTGGPGAFELNLRDEYTFGWNDDPIDFYYTAPDGSVYNFNYMVNGEEKPVDLNLLYTMLENNEPIVLTVE